jgi:hypothetical protein
VALFYAGWFCGVVALVTHWWPAWVGAGALLVGAGPVLLIGREDFLIAAARAGSLPRSFRLRESSQPVWITERHGRLSMAFCTALVGVGWLIIGIALSSS